MGHLAVVHALGATRETMSCHGELARARSINVDGARSSRRHLAALARLPSRPRFLTLDTVSRAALYRERRSSSSSRLGRLLLQALDPP